MYTILTNSTYEIRVDNARCSVWHKGYLVTAGSYEHCLRWLARRGIYPDHQ